MTVDVPFFEQAYRQAYRPFPGSSGRVPWDIGRAQPAVVALVDASAVTGAVLDIGCGLGGNAIYLAKRGFDVVGIDSAPSAVRMASERAATEGVAVHFAVADATSLAGYEGRFDTILDSGLYHCLGPEDRVAYVAALARVGRPNARLHLLSFTDELPEELPTAVSEADLRADITAPWVIEELTKTRYETAMTPEQLHSSVREMSVDDRVGTDAFASLETGDQGRAWFTAWHLVARLS